MSSMLQNLRQPDKKNTEYFQVISLHLSDNADTAEQISVMQILGQNSSSWKWPTTST